MPASLYAALFLWLNHGGLIPNLDSDHDGLSDALEQSLLVQFAPRFQMDASDCSGGPATFKSGVAQPQVAAPGGTIYGQVRPAKAVEGVEIRYYHLWETDCGPYGHDLDVEHVSVLVKPSTTDLSTATWKAAYWFAAAHENTVCDVSQIARASTLNAEDHGAVIWVSSGKHASFLDRKLCERGCGNDACARSVPFVITNLVNLGEPASPMNGSLWVNSARWSLQAKMARTDFRPAPIDRLNTLAPLQIALFNTGRHPAQGVIAISSYTADSLGSAIGNGYDSTVRAIKSSASRASRFVKRASKLW